MDYVKNTKTAIKNRCIGIACITKSYINGELIFCNHQKKWRYRFYNQNWSLEDIWHDKSEVINYSQLNSVW